MNGYILADNNGHYIFRDNKNRYVPVTCKESATIFPKRDKANNILGSCLPKAIRGRYHVEKATAPKVTSANQTEGNKPVRISLDEALEKYGDTAERISKWSESVEQIVAFAQEVEARKTELTNGLSEVDKEITDIQHYIELGTFNAYQGWEAFSLLRSCLLRRRKIKDELTVVCGINGCPIGTNTLNGVINTAKGLGGRAYGPRVLQSLFNVAS